MKKIFKGQKLFDVVLPLLNTKLDITSIVVMSETRGFLFIGFGHDCMTQNFVRYGEIEEDIYLELI